RSSCFVLDTSRKAARISAELTIQNLVCCARTRCAAEPGAAGRRKSFPMKRQPRLLDVDQRNSSLHTGPRRDHRDLRASFTFDSQNLALVPSAVRRTEHVRPATDETAPLPSGSQRPFAG